MMCKWEDWWALAQPTIEKEYPCPHLKKRIKRDFQDHLEWFRIEDEIAWWKLIPIDEDKYNEVWTKTSAKKCVEMANDIQRMG